MLNHTDWAAADSPSSKGSRSQSWLKPRGHGPGLSSDFAARRGSQCFHFPLRSTGIDKVERSGRGRSTGRAPKYFLYRDCCISRLIAQCRQPRRAMRPSRLQQSHVESAQAAEAADPNHGSNPEATALNCEQILQLAEDRSASNSRFAAQASTKSNDQDVDAVLGRAPKYFLYRDCCISRLIAQCRQPSRAMPSRLQQSHVESAQAAEAADPNHGSNPEAKAVNCDQIHFPLRSTGIDKVERSGRGHSTGRAPKYFLYRDCCITRLVAQCRQPILAVVLGWHNDRQSVLVYFRVPDGRSSNSPLDICCSFCLLLNTRILHVSSRCPFPTNSQVTQGLSDMTSSWDTRHRLNTLGQSSEPATVVLGCC